MDIDQIVSPSKWRVLLVLGGVGLGAVALGAVGIVTRAKSMQEVGTWTDAQAIPAVRIVQAKRGPEEQDLSLPGTVSAYSTGSLYARASGYIRSWNKDIGAHVKKGDVLAEISAPDLDQQLAQARAQLIQLQAAQVQAQAEADLSHATNQRTTRLVTQGWSSQAQGDTDRFTAAARQAAVDVSKANIAVQQAAVNRLEELTNFKQIVAPFDGIVTARNVDIGDLVTAEGNSGRALFQIADLRRMRTYVNVPQAFLESMKPGLKATLSVIGKKQTFSAELVSTSNAVSESSRTALVELQSDNPGGKLWPGSFAEVHFHVPLDGETLRIPTTALVFAKHGIQVARINADHKVELRPVVLGHNLGTDVEVSRGVDLSDRLIDNPQESIGEGDLVRVTGEPPPADTASVGAPGHAM
jgi:membrane fusion protein (multidrug efflux system)